MTFFKFFYALRYSPAATCRTDTYVRSNQNRALLFFVVCRFLPVLLSCLDAIVHASHPTDFTYVRSCFSSSSCAVFYPCSFHVNRSLQNNCTILMPSFTPPIPRTSHMFAVVSLLRRVPCFTRAPFMSHGRFKIITPS